MEKENITCTQNVIGLEALNGVRLSGIQPANSLLNLYYYVGVIFFLSFFPSKLKQEEIVAIQWMVSQYTNNKNWSFLWSFYFLLSPPMLNCGN